MATNGHKYSLKAWLTVGGFIATIVLLMVAGSMVAEWITPPVLSEIKSPGAVWTGWLLAVAALATVLFIGAFPWILWIAALGVLSAIGIAFPIVGVIMLAIGLLMLFGRT